MRILEKDDRAPIDEESTERSVWICPECLDAFDRCPSRGKCLNAGHAPVRVFGTAVRSAAGTEAALAAIREAERRAVDLPQGTVRRRTPEAA